jgi:FlaA1/EpsC-like NDP-sugar epimerase
MDVAICAVSFLMVQVVMLNSAITPPQILSLGLKLMLVLTFSVIMMFLFRTYAGILRHSTFTDIIKLIFASFTTGASLVLLNFILVQSGGRKVLLTTTILLYMLLSFTLLLVFRIVVKESYQYLKKAGNVNAQRVAIIGIDDLSVSVGRELAARSNLPFQLVGFLTQKTVSKRYKLVGKPVLPVKENLRDRLKDLKLDGVLMVDGSVNSIEKSKIVSECLEAQVKVYHAPKMEEWNTKYDINNPIKPIQIEDLLGREEIVVEDELIKNDISGKTVLVSGGVGSIGQQIVLQLIQYEPKLIVILDQAESSLHEFSLHLSLVHPELNFKTELADISNAYRMELLFDKYDFDIIYHAAAYKHVPMIERNPHEAVYVNILGTVNLALNATQQGVGKFVMISTDKAVNPANVMGASKRVAEMYVQALQYQEDVKTQFITTRFGNVLGSNGSVIPHFRKQISQGGPVTVTHKDIIRYFMTIPEACRLVLQAGTMGAGGDIYVFDMGEPVTILSLAEKMIQLSGYEPYKDIDIVFTGLRPGEKLYEELLDDASIRGKTHHPKIMIARSEAVEFEPLRKAIKKLIRVATQKDDYQVVKRLKEIVPEFVSNNSRFEEIDA